MRRKITDERLKPSGATLTFEITRSATGPMDATERPANRVRTVRLYNARNRNILGVISGVVKGNRHEMRCDESMD